MACNTLTSILKGCESNAGGIVTFYIVPSTEVASFVEATGQISAITMNALVTFETFEFNRNTSNYTEDMTVSLENSSTFYNQTITIQLARREATKRQALLLVSAGQQPLTCIVKDSNGLYWGFGFDDDKVYFTGNAGGSGTAKSDLNGYTLTFTCESATPAYEVDEAAVLSVI